VELEAKEQEVRVVQAGGVVTLVPGGSLMPGRRFKMTVRFGDGAAPASVSFVLVVHPAWGQRQVEVFRRKRTVESYQQAFESEAQGAFTLKLWDRGGTSTVTLDRVTFPPLQVSASPP
jgi:hypothetical protein